MTKERPIIEAMFTIANKEQQDVPFLLNPTQSMLDDNFTGRDIVPKARQEGISSYYLAKFAVACMGQRNTRAVVISHEGEATQRLLARVHYYLNHLRGPKPVLQNKSKNEITFPRMNSAFYIGTAGSRTFGRGDMITHLHCSEIAFWPDPLSLMTGLLQAVTPNGTVGMESTGNGKGNYYHRQVMRAANGEGRYRLHFFSWLDCDEYKYDLSPADADEVMSWLDPDLEEPQLAQVPGITAGHIAWRRDKLVELDYNLKQFRQEYPITLDECFQASGQGFFTKINYRPNPLWPKEADRNLRILEGHPRDGAHYVIGADPAGGVGQDNSVAQIICLETFEQVGEWSSNQVEPDIFGNTVLPELGMRFNMAYVCVEANNHGILTLSELLNRYPMTLIHQSRRANRMPEEMDRLSAYGVRTTSRNKPYILGALRREIAANLVLYSPLLKDELDSFVEKSEGKLEAEEGCKDDRVMALAMAIHGIERAIVMTAEHRGIEDLGSMSPFTLDSILEEMNGRRSMGFPISDQHGMIG